MILSTQFCTSDFLFRVLLGAVIQPAALRGRLSVEDCIGTWILFPGWGSCLPAQSAAHGLQLPQSLDNYLRLLELHPTTLGGT